MNRREFIKTASATFSIASAGTLFGAGTPSKKMRLCVVGCGRSKPANKDGSGECLFDVKGGRGRGYQVTSRFSELPNCVITVVCDVDSRAMDYVAGELKAKTGLVSIFCRKDLQLLSVTGGQRVEKLI